MGSLFNAEDAYLSSTDLRCLEEGREYRWLVRVYDNEYPLYNRAETREITAVYSPSSLVRTTTHAVRSWNGILSFDLNVRPGSRDQVTQASVSGPQPYTFNLTDDWYDISTESRLENKGWWKELA